jgi:hypothetical protein
MKRRKLIGVGLAAGLLSLPKFASAASLSHSALLIGNDSYGGDGRLANAGRDAQLMYETLKSLGVTGNLVRDAKATELDNQVARYAQKVRESKGIAWLYYAGHGVQLDGKLWLLGTDALFNTPQEIKAKSIDLDRVLGMLEQAAPDVTIVILDSCRNNPFTSQRSKAKDVRPSGFLPMSPEGVLLAYSTSPYSQSQDSPDATNGPYALALSKALLRKRRRIEEAFTEVSDTVYLHTKKQQTPSYFSSLRKAVWIDIGGVSLNPPTTGGLDKIGSLRQFDQVAGLISTPRRNAGSLSIRDESDLGRIGYRPDLQVISDEPARSPEDWAREMEALDRAAREVDTEALQTLWRKVLEDNTICNFDLTLAGLCLRGGKLAPDPFLAATHFERAARRGYVPAQTLLGELLFEALNYSEAFKWLAEAAKSGYSRAVDKLGGLTNLHTSAPPKPLEDAP